LSLARCPFECPKFGTLEDDHIVATVVVKGHRFPFMGVVASPYYRRVIAVLMNNVPDTVHLKDLRYAALEDYVIGYGCVAHMASSFFAVL
jgi:hypothetical protein